jgi:hypothetical protein
MIRFFNCIIIVSLFSGCINPKAGDKKKNTDSSHSDRIHQQILRLREIGLLPKIKNDVQLDSLEKICKSDTLNGILKMLTLGGNMLELQFAGNTKQDPVQLYEPLLQKVAAFWPDLKVDSLSGDFLSYELGSTDTGWALIRMHVDGRQYERRNYWYSDDPIDYLFYRTYNKLLADRKDTIERLFLVTYRCADCYDAMDNKQEVDLKHIGLLRMTREQAQKVKELNKVILIDDVDEFAVFSTAETEDVLQKLHASGIREQADREQFDYICSSIRQNTIYEMEDILNEFGDYFCIIDYTTANDYDPFGSDMLARMAKISGGIIPLRSIVDQGVSRTTHTVRYSIKGRLFEKDYDKHDSIWSPYLIDDVNSALEATKVGYSFYTIFSKGSRSQLIFFADAQIERAKNSGFFKEFYKGSSPEIRQLYENAIKL